MRVLITVDGSEPSFEAIDQIAPLLSEPQDEVALYCHPPQVRVRSSNISRDILAGAEESFASLIFVKARQRLGTKFAEKTHTILGHQDARRGGDTGSQRGLLPEPPLGL